MGTPSRLVAIAFLAYARAGSESCVGPDGAPGVCQAQQKKNTAQSPPQQLQVVPMDRVDKISAVEFNAHYLGKKAMVTRHPVPWGLADFVKLCPDMVMPIVKKVPADRSTALGHETVEKKTTIKELVDAWASGKKLAWYVFDANPSCSDGCPDLLANFTMPALFGRDELWLESMHVSPNILVGPAGTRSHFHIDLAGKPGWLHIYEGRKRFRFITVEDALAYMPGWFELPSGDVGPNYRSLDLFDDDAVKATLDPRIRLWDTTLRPGDVLYFPQWAIHAAVNIEGPTLHVGANFIDRPHALQMLQRFACGKQKDKDEKDYCLSLKEEVTSISKQKPQRAATKPINLTKWTARGVPWCFAKLVQCSCKVTAKEPRGLLNFCRGTIDLPDAKPSTLAGEVRYMSRLGSALREALSEKCKNEYKDGTCGGLLQLD